MNSKTPLTNRTRAANPAQEKVETATTESENTSLATRIETKPRSKSGQLRRIWPEIKAALKDGYQLKVVWECLVEDGIDLSWPKFRTYISNLRKMEAAGVDLPTAVPERQKTALVTQRHEQHSLKRDPLANLKNHLSKRPGFEFDERPPDEKKLF